MKMKYLKFGFMAVVLLLLLSKSMGAACENDVVKYENGLLSIHPDQSTTTLDVLEQIADLIDIKVYLIDDDGRGRMLAVIEGVPPEEAITRILRDKNYAAIFGKTIDPGIELLVGKSDGEKHRVWKNIGVTAQDKEMAPATVVDSDHEKRMQKSKLLYEKASLRAEIRRLEEKIESGEADLWYEKESLRIHNVVHPRDELAQLKEKLNKLSSE